jgi:PilZ domain
MSRSGPAVRKQEENCTRPFTLGGLSGSELRTPPAIGAERVPALRVMPLRPTNPARSFSRVPTHAVGVFHEKREYPRATLRLPLRLRGVDGRAEDFPITLVTRDISSSGVFFLCPRKITPQTPIELEVVLISRPLGRGNVVIVSQARVARVEPAATPGWFGIGASFEDLEFDRDDSIATRYFAI